MAKRKKKKKDILRGSGVVFSLPTDNLAGASKSQKILKVEVQAEGDSINSYEPKLGDSISFRVGGEFYTFVGRVGPAPDSPIWVDALADNKESLTVEYHHALAGDVKELVGPGQRFILNSVLMLPSPVENLPGMKISAPTWSNKGEK